MMNRAGAAIAAALCLAACSSNNATPDAKIVLADAKPIDAVKILDAKVFDAPPPADLSCVGNNAPTATATVTLSGTIQGLNLAAPASLNNAAVTTYAVGNATAVDTQPGSADTAGTFTTAALSTGTTPAALNLYLKATADMYQTSYEYPAEPVAANLSNIPVILISNSTLALLKDIDGGITQSASDGDIAVIVVDCSNNPVSGATLSVTQDGTAVGSAFDASAYEPGVTIFLNVPPGETMVSATYQGHTFLAHTVTSYAGATTATPIRPGY